MKLKQYAIALIPCCVATFVFRIVEIVLAVNPQTGYFRNGSVLPMLFNIMLALIAAFFATLLFLTKREPKTAVVRVTRPSVLIPAAGMAGSVFLFASSLFALIDSVQGTAFSFPDLLRNADLWQTVLALLSAVSLIFFVTYPKKTARQPLWQLLLLCVMGYYLMRLLRSFLDPDVVFSQAYGIYDVAFYGLAAAAALNFSKLLSGILCRRLYVFCAFTSGIVMSLRFANGVLRLIPENPYAIPTDLMSLAADLFVTVLFVLLGVQLTKRGRRKHRPTEAPQN